MCNVLQCYSAHPLVLKTADNQPSNRLTLGHPIHHMDIYQGNTTPIAPVKWRRKRRSIKSSDSLESCFIFIAIRLVPDCFQNAKTKPPNKVDLEFYKLSLSTRPTFQKLKFHAQTYLHSCSIHMDRLQDNFCANCKRHSPSQNLSHS